MAKAPAGVWGIDVGQCALKAIKLRGDPKKDRVVAEAFDYIEHPKILSQPDADPDELIASALEKFLSRNRVEGHRVFLSVPGQSGLARFVKLPPVETKKIPNIVQFEAKQQIPFPLEDVVWDFQKIGGEGEEVEGFALETEVGIFAIKRDMVDRYLAPLMAAGIEVDAVQLAPVALYNFVAYDYFWQQLRKGRQEAGEAAPEEGDTVVLLDMGADKTDVVITDGDAIWLRNLPIGGNHFTRALSKELKLTFAKAEHLKRNATKAPDPKKLYQAMRPVFTDFVNELQRSIGYFSSTHRDRSIRKVIGVGNGFKLPGLQKYLQQNLQYETDKVIELHGVVGDETLKTAAFSQNLLSFCVAYGLALQGVGQTPVQTNLLPHEVRTARLIRAKKPWSLVAAALVLAGCVCSFYGNFRIFKAVHAETFKGPQQQATNQTQEIQQWASEYAGKKQEVSDKIDFGNKLIGVELAQERLGWIKVLKIINQTLPAGNPNQEDPIEQAPEVNVERIDAVYVPDVAAWYALQDPAAQNTLDPSEKQQPPTGEGWVFQIVGFSHHADSDLFVLDYLKSFQAPQMREYGITYPLLHRTIRNEKWTPAPGAPAPSKAIEPISRKLNIASATGTEDRDVDKGGEAGGADEGTEMEQGDVQLPDEMEKELEDQAKRKPTLIPVRRTDFDIQFIWRTKKPGGEEGQPASPEGSPPAEESTS